jgi:hypothetical protein
MPLELKGPRAQTKCSSKPSQARRSACLLQGIAQVAKGTEVPAEAKYETDKGKLSLSIYTSAKGFDTPAEDNSFNEYGGDASAATWTPEKEVFADLKHIARSAQYHTLLSMTTITIPAIIQKASAQGTVFSAIVFRGTSAVA